MNCRYLAGVFLTILFVIQPLADIWVALALVKYHTLGRPKTRALHACINRLRHNFCIYREGKSLPGMYGSCTCVY